MLVKYNTFPSQSMKINHMVKITFDGQMHKESFWVWIENIENSYVTGVICNNLISDKLEIGQRISFNKDCIKEISNRSYTKEQTETSILISKARNNPITKYFESLNVKFFRGININ